jgi:hypothetical protein
MTPDEHVVAAKASNNRVWELVENPDRTAAEAREMVHAAHASLWHWLRAGEVVHEQRGEWLLSRVHVILGNLGPALDHARRCLEITEDEGLEGFDRAYAYEAMARALAHLGHVDASEWRTRAAEAVATIEGAEDRAIFESDLAAEPWSPP